MSNKIDIVFLGGVFPKEIEEKVYQKSRGSIQNAANNLQWSIINGLDSMLGKPLKILNMMFIGSYPKKYDDIFINSFNFSHANGANDYNIGFINITILKELFRLQALKKTLRKTLRTWNNEINSDKKVIMMYSIQNLWLTMAKIIKKTNKNIHICLIVPDLPNYVSMDKDKYFLNRLYKRYSINKCEKNIKYIDSFVFLTENMKDYFSIDKPYVVVEGIAEDHKSSRKGNFIDAYQGKEVVLYTGTLTEKYGVLDLVKAFITINNDNYRLIICGEGETKKEIIKYANQDRRIIYMGLLEHDDILTLQKNATVLINPRKNNEEYTKYSFPSKILEYLSSGTPVIAYKLDGVPEEYDDYIYYINGEGIEDIANKIIEICGKSEEERNEFGRKANKFVMENKNNVVQTKKILQMIQLSK